MASIDYTEYDVDLFLILHEGALMNSIPAEVNLLPEIKKYRSILCPAKEVLTNGFVDAIFTKVKSKRQAARYVKQNKISSQNMVYPVYLHKNMAKVLPEITNKHYDLAISFLNPHFITAKKIKARKRLAWIHNDYSKFEFDKKIEIEMWDHYDYIVSISHDTSTAFINELPELRNKVVLIENILSPKTIRDEADRFTVSNEMHDEENSFKILSVGRFVYQKNFENIPAMADILRQKGIQFKWYLIGFGEVDLVKTEIYKYNLQDIVKILGEKDNPYPYIKACDLYVQPSRFEGKSVSVREAQILCKPVIITAYPSALSQLENNIDGVIVPLGNEGCANGIAEVIDDTRLLERLQNNCQQRNYGNESEIKKIYNFLAEN
ncbi:glycosyltransferase [Kaistella palustris]|uniref:glycosyltransferase n=1 Tax=Kaistella palustris TaxID=493376 RepID=UPI000685FBA4|nr:glycosyltransferase [Kaistella palustris]